MMIERRILAALDACRPGSDDLQNEDHAELAEARALAREDAAVREASARIEHFDSKIQSVMEEVSLPADLAARVKQRLASAPASSDPVEEALDSSPATAETVSLSTSTASSSTVPPSTEQSRRVWLWSAVAGVAALLLVALGINLFQQDADSQLTRESLRTLSRDWHELAQAESSWKTDLSQAPKTRPFPGGVLTSRPSGFKTLSLPGDPQAVAYDVSFGTHQATLIVYQGQAAGLDPVPPRAPFNTQGVCVGLWQRNGMLFALVVEGSPANYRQMLHSNQGNLG